MNKIEQLDKLFDKWRKKPKFQPNGHLGQFIPDGIVCVEEYEASPLKVMFVLKDLDDQTPENYYERGMCDEVIKSTNSGKTWNPISEWAHALVTDSPCYIRAHELGKESFKKIAIMNLKKASGKASAERIAEFAQDDKYEIIREIEICDPDIIIACGRNDVYNVLKTVVFEIESDNENQIVFNEKMKHYGHYFNAGELIGKKKKILIVEYRHPNRSGLQGTGAQHHDNMLKIREAFFDK